jgi:hypothetical protein
MSESIETGQPPSRKRPNAEAEFSAQVAAFFRGKLAEAGPGSITVAEAEKILKDLTVGLDRDGRWRLVAGFQQQDIVFYSPQQSFKMADFKSSVLRIDKYDKAGQKPVIIPLAICELKIGSNMNTHSLITYASISTQLKSIFPHCAYYFVVDSSGMQPETVLRHSKGFDRVFLNWYKEKEGVWKAIQAHFDYLSELGMMPSSEG